MQQPGSRPCVHSTKLCELEQSHLGLFSECSLQALPAHPVRTETPPKGDGCFPSALHTEGVLGPYQELLSSGPTGPSVESTEPSPRSLVFSEVRPPGVGGGSADAVRGELCLQGRKQVSGKVHISSGKSPVQVAATVPSTPDAQQHSCNLHL